MKEQIDRWGQVRHFQEAIGQRARAVAGNNRKIPTLYALDMVHNSRLVNPFEEFFDHIFFDHLKVIVSEVKDL